MQFNFIEFCHHKWFNCKPKHLVVHKDIREQIEYLTKSGNRPIYTYNRIANIPENQVKNRNPIVKSF